MKTTIILFALLLLSTQNLVAQEREQLDTKTTIITSLSVETNSDSTDGILKIKSPQQIDMVVFTNKQGKKVLKEVPQNNQIALQRLKPGFYLLCAYCNGVKVKKGMLKKSS